MSEAEDKLTALWRADAAPARDAAFRIAVLARLEQKRFHQRLALIGLGGAALCVLTAAAAPMLAAQSASLGASLGDGYWPGLMAVLVTLPALWAVTIMRRPI